MSYCHGGSEYGKEKKKKDKEKEKDKNGITVDCPTHNAESQRVVVVYK
jgi:hypothetical protein